MAAPLLNGYFCSTFSILVIRAAITLEPVAVAPLLAIQEGFAIAASAVSEAGPFQANEGGHHGTQVHRLQGVSERDELHGHDFRGQRGGTDRSRCSARRRGA